MPCWASMKLKRLTVSLSAHITSHIKSLQVTSVALTVHAVWPKHSCHKKTVCFKQTWSAWAGGHHRIVSVVLSHPHKTKTNKSWFRFTARWNNKLQLVQAQTAARAQTMWYCYKNLQHRHKLQLIHDYLILDWLAICHHNLPVQHWSQCIHPSTNLKHTQGMDDGGNKLIIKPKFSTEVFTPENYNINSVKNSKYCGTKQAQR